MYISLLFLAAYLPFQLALNPAAGVDLASTRVLILGLFFVWLAQGLKNKKLIIKNNLQTWLIVAFLFLSAFSAMAARNTDWSARKLLFLLSIFPVYFVAANVINSKEKALKMVKLLVGSGTILAVIGVAQFGAQFVMGLEATYKFWANYVITSFLGVSFSQAVLQNPSWLVNVAGQTYLRATAIFPDPHMLAFYLGLLIPLAIGIISVEKKDRFFWGTSLVVLVLADLLTFSRGGYLGLFAGAVALIVFWWNKVNKKHKMGALVLVVLMAVALTIPSPVSQRFFSSFNLKEGSNVGRIATWQQALEVVRDNPIIGVGIGNYPLTVKASANYREPIYAHNTYLDIAAETGVLNALVWIFLLGIVFIKLYSRGQRQVLFLMMSISVIIFAAHSLAETAIYSPTVLTLFLLIISFSNVNEEAA